MKFLDRVLALVKKSFLSTNLKETVGYGRAKVWVQQRRPTRWLDANTPDPDSYEDVGEPVESENLIINTGRDALHHNIYDPSTPYGASKYIALSNDTVTETATSTTLSSEIAANGLARAAGTYAHTPGTNTATITKVFTCATAPQAAQKAALFTASSSGEMNHVLGFTQRSLQIGDQLTVVFTITLG